MFVQSLGVNPVGVLDELDRRILEYSVENSAAMRGFASGQIRPSATVELARQYYPVCIEFPLFLAAAISHVREERSRLLLVANLYEEHGNLDPTRTHPTLFRKYIHALGLRPQALAKAGEGSIGARVCERFSTVCREGPDYRAVAMLYAFETLFSPACAMVASGLRRLPLPEEAVVFFDVHAETDLTHAEQLRASLVEACRSEHDWSVAIETAAEAGRLLHALFDSVANAA